MYGEFLDQRENLTPDLVCQRDAADDVSFTLISWCSWVVNLKSARFIYYSMRSYMILWPRNEDSGARLRLTASQSKASPSCNGLRTYLYHERAFQGGLSTNIVYVTPSRRYVFSFPKSQTQLGQRSLRHVR